MEKIASLAATIYNGKDWDTLSPEERELVEALEQEGYLRRTNTPNGFVGQVQLTFSELEVA